MNHFRSLTVKRSLIILGVIVLCGLVFWYVVASNVSGALLGKLTFQLAKGSPSANTEASLSLDITTPGTLGSVVAQFCANDPLVGRPCTPPIGLDLGDVDIAEQTGPGDFTKSSASTTNQIVFTRTPSAVPADRISFELDNIVNPSSAGSYYIRILTYASNDATGPLIDSGGLAYSINNEFTATAIIPPYLLFCTGVTIPGLNCANASGDYIDFGELSSTQARRGSSQMLVATNAAQGYTIYMGGTTLISGNNIISELVGNDVSRPGVAQFGINLRANSSPSVGSEPAGPGNGVPTTNYGQTNRFRFVNGESLATYPAPDDIRQYTVSYLVNVPSTQPSGVYVSTLTYVCLANF